ncbi:MAG: transposase, partial [Actinomycetota bacterium]|nr:transposase [Actinomycetota bacterium]
ARGGEEVVGHDVIVAIGPVRVVDPARATRDFADRLRGFVQQAHYWWANRLWSASYFAGSVGGAPITVLRQYIESQRRPP